MSAPVDPGHRRGKTGIARPIAIVVLLVLLAAAAYFLFFPGAWAPSSESDGSGSVADSSTDDRDRLAADPAGPTAPTLAPGAGDPDPNAPDLAPELTPPSARPAPPSRIRNPQAFVSEWSERVSAGIPDDWTRIEDPFERVVAATNAIVLGEDPMKQLRFLRPEGRFEPNVDAEGGITLAPEQMDRRYRRFLDAFHAVDPDLAAEAFRLAEPTLDRAHRALGYPAGRFRDVLIEAISVLRATPIPDQPIALEARAVTYAFADEELERLDPAQRLLLRLSPAERRRVDRKLAALAASLASPPD